jgi:tetratricopeptide (TPR) repeat protein
MSLSLVRSLVNPEQGSPAGSRVRQGRRPSPAAAASPGTLARAPLAASVGIAAALTAMLLGSGCTTAATLKAAQAEPMTAAQGANLKRIPESSRGGHAIDPANELTGDLLYEFLVAELALQRGQPQLGAQAYLDLAKKTHDPRIARRATEVTWFAHLPQLASEAVRIWNDTAPDSDEAKLWQLQIWVATNHLDEATPGLERMLAKNPADQSFLQLARLLAEASDKQAALKLMRHLTEPYESVAAAHVAVAQVAAAASDDDLALTETRAASKLRPAWEVPVILEAGILQRRSSSAAADRLKTFLEANPKSTEVRMAYARALANDRQYIEARKQFELLVEADPDDANIVYPVALLSMQLEDYPQAEVYLRRLLDLDFNDQSLLDLYLGQVIEEQKRYREANEWYAKVEPGEQYVTAQIRMASLTAKMGDLPAALKRLHDIAADGNQQHVQVLLAETQLLRDANKTQEAFDTAQKALDTLPNHPDLLYDYAMLAERLDRLDVMETNLRKVMTLQPEQAQAYNALGYSLADRGIRLPEARDLIEKALKLSPDDFFIVDSLGWVKFKEGDLNGALGELQRAYTGRPDAEIAAHLGEVLWRLGRTDEATKVWDDASRRTPGNETLQKTMKRFLSSTGASK